MKRSAIFSLTLASLALAAGMQIHSVGAQDRPAPAVKAPKVGVINLMECLDPDKYAWRKEINDELKTLKEEIELTLESLAKDSAKVNDLIKGVPGGSSLYWEYQDRKATLAARIDAQKKIGQYRYAYRSRQRMTELLNEINHIAKVIGKAGSYDIVLRADEIEINEETGDIGAALLTRKMVLHYSNSVDITEEVLQKLNEEYEQRKASGSSTPKNTPYKCNVCGPVEKDPCPKCGKSNLQKN